MLVAIVRREWSFILWMTMLVERAVALFHHRYASAVYRAATMHCDTEAVMRHNMGPTTQELRDRT